MARSGTGIHKTEPLSTSPSSSPDSPGGSRSFLELAIFASLLVLWLGISFISLRWHVNLVDEEWNQQLLQQAVFLAQNLEVDLIRPLTFGPEDRERPEFQRLSRYFKDYLPVIGCRGIYTLAERDGQLRFGPESYEPDDPQASPPGTVYQQPSPELLNLFRQPKPFTKGPWTDEYGTFYSALAPVFDPHSGRLLLAVGLDVEAADWQAALGQVRLKGGAVALAWGLVLLGCGWLWTQRGRWPWVPVCLTAILGLLLTVTVTLLVSDWQHHAQKTAMRREIATQAEFIINNCRNLKEQILPALGRFFESSDEVTSEEFQHYTAPLLKTTKATAFLWLPVVPAAQRPGREASLRANGHPRLRMWELTPEGHLGPVTSRSEYVPVLYAEPGERATHLLGYDLNSDPAWRARLQQAAATGLPVAAPAPPALIREPGELLCCLPVYGHKSKGKKPQGWVAAWVKAAALLALPRYHEEKEPVFSAALWRLNPENSPQYLGGDEQAVLLQSATTTSSPHGWSPSPVPVFPLFCLGQTLALVLLPQAALWTALSFPLAVPATMVSGLLLTIMATLLSWSVISRRLELEALVFTRTAALRDRESYLATLLDILADGVFITTFPERQITYVNRAGGEIFGWPATELVGQSTRVLYDSEEEYLRYGAQIAKALNQGETRTQSEIRFRRRDGSLVWGEAHTVLLKKEQELQFLVSVVRDISERKKLEQEREHLQQQLFQTQKLEAVGRLASGIVHDFNNLLSLIMGQMELLLLDLPADSPWQQSCNLILEAGQQAAALTRQLLIFTRQQPATPQVLDLNAAIEGQLKLLSHFLGENITLSWKPAPNLGPVRIDPQQLEQILSNLLINARDAIQGLGQITIATAEVELDEEFCRTHVGVAPGPYVRLSVSDTGCGMDQETRSRIFEPFFTTKPPGQGTGLGLATVYGIVRQHGGLIEVDSEVGQGTTFKIYLPRYEAEPESEVRPTAATASGRETILVVEDDPALLQLTRQLLEHLGYQVLTAPGPEPALELSHNYSGDIQLLLTDIIMPAMNGRELYQRLVAQRPGLKVLYTSGYSEDVISHDGILQEGTAFLPKPFSLPQLAAKVREVLASG